MEQGKLKSAQLATAKLASAKLASKFCAALLCLKLASFSLLKMLFKGRDSYRAKGQLFFCALVLGLKKSVGERGGFL